MSKLYTLTLLLGAILAFYVHNQQTPDEQGEQVRVSKKNFNQDYEQGVEEKFDDLVSSQEDKSREDEKETELTKPPIQVTRSPAIEGGAESFNLADISYAPDRSERTTRRENQDQAQSVVHTPQSERTRGLDSSSSRDIHPEEVNFEQASSKDDKSSRETASVSEKGEVFNCRSNLMVRTQPSQDSRFIGRLPCSDNPEVTILSETDNGWYQISYGDGAEEAYVHGDYIRLIDATEEVITGLDQLRDFTPEVSYRDCRPFGMEEDCEEDALSRSVAEEGLVENDPYAGDWIEGCEILNESFDHEDFEKLSSCMDSIKDSISEGMNPQNLNRDQVFRNMYDKLNPKEQEFAAMILTSVGEAGILAPPFEEMVVVMKVLNNRKKYAQEKGFEQANELDVALQPWQFSIYNHNTDHWARAINESADSPNTRNAISAYIRYQDSNYSHPPEIDRVYHYHANYVSPDWADQSKLVRPQINNQSLKDSGTRHVFYRDIPWSFRHNQWSGKK